MSEPAPLSPRAKDALDAFATVTAAPPSPRALEVAWSQAARPRTNAPSVLRLTLAFAVSCAVAGGVMSTVLLAKAKLRAPGNPAQLEAGPGAVFVEQASDVQLKSGRVRVHATDLQRTIVTMQTAISLTHGRVLVEAIEGLTVLWVEEGEAMFRDGAKLHRATAGSRVSVPVELKVLTTGDVGTCDGRPAAEVEGCLRSAANGEGLEAQTALFELGLRAHEAGALPKALDHFAEYQRRFPSGVLAPEVSIARMLGARATGAFDLARSEATSFLTRFPEDPRATDVQRWAASLK